MDVVMKAFYELSEERRYLTTMDGSHPLPITRQEAFHYVATEYIPFAFSHFYRVIKAVDREWLSYGKKSGSDEESG